MQFAWTPFVMIGLVVVGAVLLAGEKRASDADGSSGFPLKALVGPFALALAVCALFCLGCAAFPRDMSGILAAAGVALGLWMCTRSEAAIAGVIISGTVIALLILGLPVFPEL